MYHTAGPDQDGLYDTPAFNDSKKINPIYNEDEPEGLEGPVAGKGGDGCKLVPTDRHEKEKDICVEAGLLLPPSHTHTHLF